MKIKYQSTMHEDGHYPPIICLVQCRCYWMMQMLICIKINSYARNIISILKESGMNDHVAKPIDMNVLLPTIMKYM